MRTMRAQERPVRALALALASFCLAAVAHAAPEVQLRVARGPYYVGAPIDVHVQAVGLERRPDPSCRANAPPDTSLQLLALVPNISASMQIVNGRVSRSESVTFVCQYRFVASRPGRFRLAPFEVEQDGTVLRTDPYALDVQAVPQDAGLKVRIALPDEPVYIGQQIPVRVEWWLDANIADRISSYSIRSALFDDPDAFRFLADDTPARGEQALELSTAEGEIALRADVERRDSGGRSFLVLTAERRLVPLRAGIYDLAPATVHVEEVTRWQRDLFGSRRPAGTRRLFGRDEPLRLEVRAAPKAGRPPSFGGAIGRGFSLEVTADRSVVQLGDPITLTLTVRGDGHLASVGLPPLDGPGGLPTDGFRLSEGSLSGELIEGGKRFEIPVRVLDDGVREVPALEYAWFDPELGEYQTTTSRPIALSVRPAQVIGAADVVASTPVAPAGTEEGAARGDAPGERARGSLSLSGADLSIERRVDRLLARGVAPVPAQVALYGAGLSLLAGALVLRRRGARSPRVARLEALCVAARERIDRAASLPRAEALAEAAAALREVAAADPSLRSDAVDAFVRECDEVVYAPGGAGGESAADGTARARDLLDALAERIE